MKFITESNSIYEIDKENSRIRKLNSQEPSASKRIGGDWKSFARISPVVVGKSVLIFWNDAPALPETIEAFPEGGSYAPFTHTNLVSSVVEEHGDPS